MAANVFTATADGVTFTVKNSTQGALSNQSILVFLTPQTAQTSYLYAAWQNLQPGDGASAKFNLTNTISASVTNDQYTSNTVVIPLQNVSDITSSNNASPTLGTPYYAPTVVTAAQQGLVNKSTVAAYPQWFVNGNLMCQGNNTITNGGTSTFALLTTLYWYVGEYVATTTYQYQNISAQTAYVVPTGVASVTVTVTKDTTANKFIFSFNPPSA